MPRRSYPPTVEQDTTLPIDDGLGEGDNVGLLIPLDLNEEYPPGAQPVDYETGGVSFEPPESRMKFPPLHPQEGPAPAAAPAQPAQKIVQWGEISAHPSFSELDTENKLTALDKWAEFVRGKIGDVDDPDTARAALDKYVSAQGAVISPTYATAKELKTKMQEENRAGGFDFFLGPLPDDQVARLSVPMNGSQLSLARTGIPDIWGELNEKRKAETAFFEMRKDLVKEAGDEELADLIIERERERRRVEEQLPIAQKAADAIMDKIDKATDPDEQAQLQKQYSAASAELLALQRNLGNTKEVHADDRLNSGAKPARAGRLGELDAQIAARADAVSKADNGVSADQSALGAFAMTWGKNSTNFLEHNFIGKAMTKATDLMMQLAGAPAGSAQGAANDLGATMDEVLAGRIPEGMSKALMNPALHNSRQEQIARGVGSLMDPKTPSLFIGGWPGIAAFGMMAGQQDYSATAAHTLQTGGTEEQARKDGLTAAAWTLPTLVAYGVAGKVIGGAAGKLLPATATPLARAAIQLPANTFANMTASAALRVARGEDFIPENFIEHAAPDVLFALHGATDAYKNAAEIQRLRPTMEAMAAGTHPDAVLRKAIIDSPVFDDGAKKLAAAELAAFQRGAAEFLVNIGAKVPEDTGLIDRPGRGEAYQRMLDLAQERTALMRKMNDPAAPPPEGAVHRLAELHNEMRDLIESPALSGKPAAAEPAGQLEPASVPAGSASTEAEPKRAAQPEPAPEPPPIAPEHALAIHDAQADLDWALGSGDAAEVEAARGALEAAKARAAQTPARGEPAPVEPASTPEAPKGLRGGYDALVGATGFPAVSIAALAKESGIPLEDLKGQLTQLHAEGKVALSIGDWSLSDEATRAGALDVPGQPRNLQVRFLDEAAPPAAPAAEQDARVGAAKPLRAGEDIRPERDMFGADAAEGDDLFDRKPAAPAAEPAPAAELPAAEPAPEPAPPVESKPSAKIELELTPEQQVSLSKVATALANDFEWRNDAEKDSAIAEVQTKLEKGARTYLQGIGSLDGFSAHVVARSRFRDILKRSEAKKVSNAEPAPGDEGKGGGDTDKLPAWTDATAEPVPSPDEVATKKEAAAKVKDAMSRLSDKGETADDKRKILEGVANGDDHTTIADDLGWTVGKDKRSDVTRVARGLRRAVDEILRDTQLKREDVFGLLPPGMARMMADVDTGIHFARSVWDSIAELKPFNDFRRSLLNWSMTQQRGSNEVFNMLHFMERNVPRPAREGITNWIQAGGDRGVLETRRDATTQRDLRDGYQAALDLTPEQIRIARHIQTVYDRLLQRGRAYGLLSNGLQDYVNQIWQQPNALAGILRLSSARRINEYFRFNQARIHDSFFDGEQSGLRPVTKDISKLLAIYLNEMNNAIASRRLVLDLRRGRASDGRPLISPTSRTVPVADAGGGRTVLVYPDRLPANLHDYRALPDQPALHSWVWSSVDAAGNPTLVDADMVLHPEIHDHMRKVLSGSRLRDWWQSPSRDPLQAIPKAVVKFMLDDVQAIAKQTMLGFFSPFHAVQEGTHAIFHRVNPFYGLPHVDLTRSAPQRDAAAHGLMLMPDRVSKAVFIEGLGATDRNVMVHIIRRLGAPGRFAARLADDFQHWLFHSYIPALKYKTYEHILERNRERYQEEFANGSANDDQVKYLSAQQANAAYGHLNYADMGRSANWMHLSSSLLLAPDFLEARARFTGQALKGALGTKNGREQFTAMMFGAAGLWFGARILNKIGDDDWHWDEGFDIIHGNRRYTIRSVPEDIVHAITDTRKFVMGRVSPVVKLGIESSTGRNYRGEKVEGWEPFRDFVASIVPLTVQPFTRGMSDTTKNNPVTRGEQLMGALGLHVARYSPITSVYPIANKWREENAGKIKGVTKPDNSSYPVSKYQQLRYALDDGDYERAAREFAKLEQPEEATVKVPAYKIRDGFKESLHHPFTGTEKTDRKFRESLTGKDRDIFDAASARRHLIWDRFVKMRQAAASKQKSPTP